MFHLSDSDKLKAKARALWIIAADTFSVLTDRKAPHTDKEDAVLAMMAIDWAPALAKAVGFKPLNEVLKYVREDVFGPDQYRLLRIWSFVRRMRKLL